MARQRYLAVATDWLPWVALIGVVVGLALAAYGLLGWNKRQRVADEVEDQTRERGRLELKALTDAEKMDKIAKDAQESAQDARLSAGSVGDDGSSSAGDEASPDPKSGKGEESQLDEPPASSVVIEQYSEPRMSTSSRPTAVSLTMNDQDIDRASLHLRIAEIERRMVDRLVRAVPAKMKLVPNISVRSQGRVAAFDAVAVDAKTIPRYLFDVKYASSSRHARNALISSVRRSADWPHLDDATPMILLVVEELDPKSMNSLQGIAHDYLSNLNRQIGLVIFSADEVESMSDDEFAERLGLR